MNGKRALVETHVYSENNLFQEYSTVHYSKAVYYTFHDSSYFPWSSAKLIVLHSEDVWSRQNQCLTVPFRLYLIVASMMRARFVFDCKASVALSYFYFYVRYVLWLFLTVVFEMRAPLFLNATSEMRALFVFDCCVSDACSLCLCDVHSLCLFLTVVSVMRTASEVTQETVVFLYNVAASFCPYLRRFFLFWKDKVRVPWQTTAGTSNKSRKREDLSLRRT